MPFTPADATKHSKKAQTPAQQAQWARVANSVRTACMSDGGDETKCDASAVQQANGVIREHAARLQEKGVGYGAKKGEQISGSLYRGGGGRFTGGPSDEELAGTGIERSQSDALLAMLAGDSISSQMAEELRNMGLLSPTNEFTKFGKATAEALKAKDADEVKRLVGLAKPKGGGGGGGGGGGSGDSETEREKQFAIQKAIIAQAVKELNVPENLLNIFFDFTNKEVQNPKEEMLAQVAKMGLLEIDKNGFYKMTAAGKKLLKATENNHPADAMIAIQKAQQSMEEETEEREMSALLEITQGVFEIAYASLTGDTNTKETDRLRLLESFKVDFDKLQEAKTKTVDGQSRPAGDFLVVGSADEPSTWRLPVKVNGKPDRRLMGAAKAALGPGFRGNAYEGPDKAAATSKLKGMYKSEGMEWAEAEQESQDTMRELLERALALCPEAEPQEVAESSLTESAGGFLALSEADAQPAEGNRAPLRVEFALIKPGFGNKRDNNYYPADVLKRDAHVFEGVKMYTTDHKQHEKSERTEVGVVEKMPLRFLEDGTPVGVAAIFDPTFAEKTRNRAEMGQLATLENSIVGKGRTRKGKIDDRKANIVEAMTEGVNVDWVTKAGAGGRALNLAESEPKEVTEVNDNEVKQDGEQQPDEETKTEPTPETTPEPEATPTETEPVEEVFLSEADTATILAEAKLPDEAKARLQVGQYENDDALKTAVQAEAVYIKAVTGAGKPVMAQGRTTTTQPRTLAERNEAIDGVNDRWI